MHTHNYHTHHGVCPHAKGSAEAYVKEAIALNMADIGFSDHAPSTFINDKNVRMSQSDFSHYLADIKAARDTYKDRINVYIGLESEFLDPKMQYYEDLLKDVDYLILGQHYIFRENPSKTRVSSFFLETANDVYLYAISVVEAIKTGYFSLVAHPDLYMCGYEPFDDTDKQAALMIIEASITYNVPLEFNANGLRRGIKKTKQGDRYHYPVKAFWELARDKGCTIVFSSDAHKPTYLYDDTVKKAEALAQSWNITFTRPLNFK
jgi:histidinol-phosphatase (PHP family)